MWPLHTVGAVAQRKWGPPATGTSRCVAARLVLLRGRAWEALRLATEPGRPPTTACPPWCPLRPLPRNSVLLHAAAVWDGRGHDSAASGLPGDQPRARVCRGTQRGCARVSGRSAWSLVGCRGAAAWEWRAGTGCTQRSLTSFVSILSLCRKSQSPLHPGRTLPHLQPAEVVALQPHTAASDPGTGQLSPSCYTCFGSLTSDYTACPLSLVLGELQSSSKARHFWLPPQLPVLGHGAGPAGQGLWEVPWLEESLPTPRLDTPMPKTMHAQHPGGWRARDAPLSGQKAGTPRPCSGAGG